MLETEAKVFIPSCG